MFFFRRHHLGVIVKSFNVQDIGDVQGNHLVVLLDKKFVRVQIGTVVPLFVKSHFDIDNEVLFIEGFDDVAFRLGGFGPFEGLRIVVRGEVDKGKLVTGTDFPCQGDSVFRPLDLDIEQGEIR